MVICDKVLVSQGDIQTLFGILNENLQEGVGKENQQLTISGGTMMFSKCSVEPQNPEKPYSVLCDLGNVLVMVYISG